MEIKTRGEEGKRISVSLKFSFYNLAILHSLAILKHQHHNYMTSIQCKIVVCLTIYGLDFNSTWSRRQPVSNELLQNDDLVSSQMPFSSKGSSLPSMSLL